MPVFHLDLAPIYQGCKRAIEPMLVLLKDPSLNSTPCDFAPGVPCARAALEEIDDTEFFVRHAQIVAGTSKKFE